MNIDKKYYQVIRENLNNTIQDTNIDVQNKQVGKVRDAYFLDDKVLMVSTDRQSAFDRVLARIPYKGVVLNLVSAWWFKQTKNLFPNHFIGTPDPNISLVEKCTVFQVEFVVRGYITGSTETSLWTVYNNGATEYCGNQIPSGLKKNQKLASPMLTPTTKDKVHDRPVSKAEILGLGLMTEEDYDVAAKMSLDLFSYGQKVAADNGLILVDTKYELGKDASGNIKFVDEIHTPDSSRYWIEETYQSRFSNNEEPQNIDKEFLRLWFAKNCDPYSDEALPAAPDELIVELSARYILLYELITGEKFVFPELNNINQRINENIKELI
jgi:phosphoribosylaminoimidazole-succinocarboxamide synthase|tara:strand:+ start:6412 stop:7386 length:975 start_codon:yes stop_codon:yes gene_type:complete